MQRFLLTVLLAAGLCAPLAALAGGRNASYVIPPVVGPHPPIWRYNGPPQQPPFARSERAQAVWASGACWSECNAYCAWNLNACLYQETQGACLIDNDDCARACQRSCRTEGGPFLPIE